MLVALLLATLAWAVAEPRHERTPLVGKRGLGSELRTVAGQRCPRAEGPFGPGNWPSACWRPYSAASPFNRPLPANPRVLPRSRAVVDRLMDFGGPQNIVAGRAGSSVDYGHPAYWSQPGDPWFTVHCTKPWGRCALEGLRIRVPERARPAGGSDGHLTVSDQQTGWEYDMWAVKSKPTGGGTLVTAWGGRTRLDGNGLGSAAVAASYGSLAGELRAPELGAGEIGHALFMYVRCDSGRVVYPAVHHGLPCSDDGLSNADAPAMGQRFQLDMSGAEIDALAVPAWKKTILRAMARYGMFVGDTGGSWGIKEEGGLMYTSLGYSDPWVKLAKHFHVPYNARDGLWIFDLASDVDWRGRLRAIDPCVARGTCR